jgi:hypothetical protein
MVSVIEQPQTVEGLASEIAEVYLDWSGGDQGESIYAMPLNPKVRIDELEEALFWRAHARGTIGIFAPPGGGKTLLLTLIGLKMNYFFQRPVVMDYYPKQRFIDQVGKENFTYIDEDTLLQDLQEIDKLARHKDWNLSKEKKTEWVIEGKGSSGIKLHGCSLLLSEIDRWVNCRRTGTKINELITDLFKRWRHYDIMVAGDCVDKADLDRQRIANRFSTTVYCNPLPDNMFRYIFKSVEELTRGGVRHVAKTERLMVDGRDVYGYYFSRNPIALSPTLRLKEPKQRVVVDRDTGEILKREVV